MPQLSPHALLMLILPLYITLLLLYVGHTRKIIHIQKSGTKTPTVVHKLLYIYYGGRYMRRL